MANTPKHFADRLLQACKEKGAPICVGIDPVLEKLPVSLREGVDPRSALQCVEVIGGFCAAVLQRVAPLVPIVKFQSACFERYLWPGVELLHHLIAEAKGQGLLVILDAKRGDIGSSSEHYAAGCLGEPGFSDLGAVTGPDALTVNSYLGMDGIAPFLEVAAAEGKGLFALVRTSNPGGDELQSSATADGGRVVDIVASMVARAGEQAGYVGGRGYSLLGAVVGATKPEDARLLREMMPQQVFLVPGFGAQGGTAEDARACFRDDGTGALISASRSVLFAYEKRGGEDWLADVEAATVAMREQVARVLEQ